MAVVSFCWTSVLWKWSVKEIAKGGKQRDHWKRSPPVHSVNDIPYDQGWHFTMTSHPVDSEKFLVLRLENGLVLTGWRVLLASGLPHPLPKSLC